MPYLVSIRLTVRANRGRNHRRKRCGSVFRSPTPQCQAWPDSISSCLDRGLGRIASWSHHFARIQSPIQFQSSKQPVSPMKPILAPQTPHLAQFVTWRITLEPQTRISLLYIQTSWTRSLRFQKRRRYPSIEYCFWTRHSLMRVTSHIPSYGT